MCALGGTAVWRVLPSHRTADKPVLLQSLPLDSEPASETAPAFSPDGGSIVYASDLGSPGIHHIVTRSVAGLASGRAGSKQPLFLTSVTGHRFWTLGQGGIYFVDALKTPAVLKFVDLVSRKGGDAEAAGRLVELFYPELRRIAAAHEGRAPGSHAPATAVVHQLYLELVKVKALRPTGSGGEDDRAEFLGLAAYLMKRLLIHHARPLSKRAEKAELPDLPGPHSYTEHSLLQIDDVLNRLAALNPALRRVVELRVFEGLTREEIARKLGCGTATVARHWNFARNWPEEALAGTPGL
jgi:RNA polymerase sigma factor (TIGR02999 family)